MLVQFAGRADERDRLERVTTVEARDLVPPRTVIFGLASSRSTR